MQQYTVVVKRFFILFSFTLIFFVLISCSPNPEQVQLNGETMGTYYSIKYIESENIPSAEEIQKAIDARLVQVNNEMSTYQKDSELSRFNQSTSLEPFVLSKNTTKVIAEALRLNKLSEGALDITVGPLVNLWGFGPQMRVERMPTEAELTENQARTGIELLSLNANKLSKKNPQLYVDLSSIAKGFAVDYVAEYLSSLGINNYLVEIGGELQLKGNNAQGNPWRIAIEKPLENQQSIQEIISPNSAVATSGDYRNYFEQDGIRYSHVINPKTAKPINHRLVSVTVLDKSSMTADGLATAFMVLGAEKGIQLANKENIPALFIVKTDDGFQEFTSDTFKPYLKQK